MRVAIAGGKGGTGKTLVAVCLVQYLSQYLAQNPIILLDADVEEPDAGLFFYQAPIKSQPVYRQIPSIDREKCGFCGHCARVCAFKALVVLPEEVLIFPELCHSCSACHLLCSFRAVSSQPYMVGEVEESVSVYDLRMITGRLRVGEPRPQPVIQALKKYSDEASCQIIDCPPGTSCSLMTAIKDADFCLLVTEPTPFGRHDLALAIEAAQMSNVPVGVVINRWQGDDGGIDELVESVNETIVARIPYDPELARLYARGENPVNHLLWLGEKMEAIWREVQELSKSTAEPGYSDEIQQLETDFGQNTGL